ncbi:4Fe-4S binding protein [Nostoc edaphicum CCNP1411]|uniref:4Fe-4S binding protein n=1 Tax=Nostoc edaphicum CCNP1411 TaxID=1472755 RepID=A0A7D7Q9F1_9NOSO|nr:LdpA C-terminal domain-containing domain [Nostoc edaphicum]QMS87235.1 4Fe-4S binding protein [Nostoc edaphicum CCNP1411]
MTDLFAPLQSLKQGDWFKLICGASFQHLPAVRSLTLAYTLAGADCIDVAADPAVIAAAQAGLQVAKTLATDAQKRGFGYTGNSPFLMVSLNDGEDPHFRKAEFNPSECPTDCPRPCERICPAQAIVFNNRKEDFSGVVSEKCYGCGRCIPICPYDMIYTSSYVSTPAAIAPLVISTGVDAVEIHTKVGRLAEFEQLWQAISPWADQLKLLAISCPDGEGMTDYLKALYDLITPLKGALIWQTDGRPMSGDIGDGTTIAAVKLGQKVLAAKLPGYVQLAGGTNSYTVAKLKAMGLLNSAELPVMSAEKDYITQHSAPSTQHYIAGIAYGSYARVLLSPILEQLENKEVSNTNVKATVRLEEDDKLLWQAVELAHSLVSQIKSQQER